MKSSIFQISFEAIYKNEKIARTYRLQFAIQLLSTLQAHKVCHVPKLCYLNCRAKEPPVFQKCRPKEIKGLKIPCHSL
jgi:hypothetical protein